MTYTAAHRLALHRSLPSCFMRGLQDVAAEALADAGAPAADDRRRRQGVGDAAAHVVDRAVDGRGRIGPRSRQG